MIYHPTTDDYIKNSITTRRTLDFNESAQDNIFEQLAGRTLLHVAKTINQAEKDGRLLTPQELDQLIKAQATAWGIIEKIRAERKKRSRAVYQVNNSSIVIR